MLILSLRDWWREEQQIPIILVVRPKEAVRAAAARSMAKWPWAQVTPPSLWKPLYLQGQATIPWQSPLKPQDA